MSKFVSIYDVKIGDTERFLTIPNEKYNDVYKHITKLISKHKNAEYIISDIVRRYNVGFADKQVAKKLTFSI